MEKRKSLEKVQHLVRNDVESGTEGFWLLNTFKVIEYPGIIRQLSTGFELR
jgi:hypothetical protein